LISLKTLPDAYDIVRTITTNYKYIHHFGNINEEYMSVLHLNWYIANFSALPTSVKKEDYLWKWKDYSVDLHLQM